MTMTNYDEIAGATGRLSRWKAAAFAASCAERLLPVVRQLEEVEQQGLYEGALEDVWRFLSEPNAADALSHRSEQLSAVLESDASEPDSLQYVVMRAFEVVAYAIAAVKQGEPKAAAWAASAALEIFDTLDSIVEGRGDDVAVVDPKNPPPAGTLERKELAAEGDAIALLGAAGDEGVRRRTIDTLRAQARAQAAALAEVVRGACADRW